MTKSPITPPLEQSNVIYVVFVYEKVMGASKLGVLTSKKQQFYERVDCMEHIYF